MEAKKHKELIAHLYDEMFSKLLRLARVAGYNRDDAYELVQETFVVAIRNIDSLIKSDNREGWLTITLRNLIKNDKRDRAKVPTTLPIADDDFDPDDEQSQGYILPSNDKYPFETDDFFVRAVGEQAYELFKDVRVHKLSNEELEAKYGTKAINCQNRASRIKKKMIKALRKNF